MSNPDSVAKVITVEWSGLDEGDLGSCRNEERRGEENNYRDLGVRLDCFREQSLAARRPMKAKECLLSKREDDERKYSLLS